MNKGQVIGLVVTGLAVIGGVAVYNWVRKPKRNADGFFNASGTRRMSAGKCRYCRDTRTGNIYTTDASGVCRGGDFCVAKSISE